MFICHEGFSLYDFWPVFAVAGYNITHIQEFFSRDLKMVDFEWIMGSIQYHCNQRQQLSEFFFKIKISTCDLFCNVHLNNTGQTATNTVAAKYDEI